MTSPERQKRPAAHRKPVEREKSLSLDDVFAKSFLKDASAGSSNRHRTPKESRSLCGDRTTKKSTTRSKPRGDDYDGAEESGNETDTGHSVVTTGHRSQRRISKINKGTSTAAASPVKRPNAATASAKALAGLYSSPNHGDDTDSDESCGRNEDISPVKRSQSSKTKSLKSHRPESSKDRSCRRAVSDAPTSGAQSSAEQGASHVPPGASVKPGTIRSNRGRPENARAQSSINLSTDKPDRVRILDDDKERVGGDKHLPGSPSKSRREKERSERNLGERPKPKSERHLKERVKSERYLAERELRERSKSRTPVPPSSKPGEGTPHLSRSTRSREGTPRQTSSTSSEQRSRSRRRTDDTKEEMPTPPDEKTWGKTKSGSRIHQPHQPSPSKSRTQSRARDKPSSTKHGAAATAKTTSRGGHTTGKAVKQPHKDSRISPSTDRRKTESTGATATATEDALSSSEESSNGDDAQGSSTVLQFDPTQQGDNRVYRVQQVSSVASSSPGMEGQIVELVDPLGAAQQLEQPSGHPKDNPIFQFLDSDDFEFFPSSSVVPLDRPSGDEASEDDDLVNSPGNNDSLLSFGGGGNVHPDLAEKLGRDENAFGYSGDGTFVDDNNPYGYNVEEKFESQHESTCKPAVHGNESYDEDAYLYDDDDVGRGSFSNPYGFGAGEPMLSARDSFGEEGSQLYETDSTSHYDQQSTLHDSFMPQSGAPQFNPSTFSCTEPFFINSEEADDASFEDAWGASQADPKASAMEFDQSFDRSFNFEELKRPASTDGSRSKLHQSHESKALEGPLLGDGPKKKRVVKVKVVKKSASSSPLEDKGVQEKDKTTKRKAVRRKVKSVPQNDSNRDATGSSTKEHEQELSVSEPINERKKALHQMKTPKTPTTPSKLFVSKLYGSLSRFNNSGNLHSDDGSLPDEAPIGSNKPVSHSPAATLQSGASPGVSASGKRPAFATSIGRYFSRTIRNPPMTGSVGHVGDEGSISTNNSRGSRGSLGLFVGKKSSRAKHQLLGDDSSYDSGNLVKRS